MTHLTVHKFGGTSVGDAGRIARAAALAAEFAARGPTVVVSSAMARMTDALIEAATAAVAGEPFDPAPVLARHLGAMAAPEPAVQAEIEALVAEVDGLLGATCTLRELTPRTKDRVVSTGERLAVRLLAAHLRARGVEARAVDAHTFLDTDGRFGEAAPLPGVTGRGIVAALRPLLVAGVVPVVTGFCGRSPEGAITTLGRGGSDYTATLLAEALGARRVFIWTDVPGVFSADPRVVRGARRVAQLNYREAAELSFYGAKVLHPLTLAPVADKGIPVEVRSSFAPEAPGTVIDGRFTPGSHPVKAISAVRAQALVTVRGAGMTSAPEMTARAFGALAEAGLSVTMISQASSEASLCLAMPVARAERAAAALRRAFRADLGHGLVEAIEVLPGIDLLACVGLGMAHHPGLSGRILGALGAAGVNVRAIAQGASELNVSVAIDSGSTDLALRALHDAFRLDRIDTGDDGTDRLDVLLVGCGRVGRSLLRQLEQQRDQVRARFGVTIRVVGAVDRRGWAFDPKGLDVESLRAAKAAGEGLPGARPGDALALIEHAVGHRLAHPVLVDVTDAASNGAVWRAALAQGADVVTANKGPLAAEAAAFDALVAEARGSGGLLKVETTVGAGLPIIDTLEVLRASGDDIVRVEGALSGTLGFVLDRVQGGAPFSEAVAEAARLGYTEPDPVVDLSGVDVARKATILARWAGLKVAPAVPEPLVDPSLAGKPLPDLLTALAAVDAIWAERAEAAAARGEALRYAATVEPGAVTVGVVSVPLEAPLGRLRGADNLVSFTTTRYREQPLVVSGPGAGVEVTAQGVLGDLLRIAAERGRR